MYLDLSLKKWIEVPDQSGESYKINKQIRFKTSMQQTDLCHYRDAYKVLKGPITVTDPYNNAYDKKLAFKNNAPFIRCISKFNNKLIDNAEDFDIVTLTYNLIEYSKNYSKTTRCLWNWYREKPYSDAVGDIPGLKVGDIS